MIRYTKEQKEAALSQAQEIGIIKTHNETGISIQTLYKWRAEAEGKTGIQGWPQKRSLQRISGSLG